MNDAMIIEKAKTLDYKKSAYERAVVLAAYDLILQLYNNGDIAESELRSIQKDYGICVQ